MIKKRYAVLFLGVVAFYIIACKEFPQLLPSDYVRWVKNPENGLVQSKVIKELEFTAHYKPLDFVVAQEERTNTLPKKVLEKRREELGEVPCTPYVGPN